ncbi:MAG: hypothetical protein HY257_05590 [Chloroflexi bacterium]|nr:hypothetical protein [Chloroflexota bacterium]
MRSQTFQTRLKRFEIIVGILLILVPLVLILNLVWDKLAAIATHARELGLGIGVAAFVAKIRAAYSERDFRADIILWAITLAGLVLPLFILPNEKSSVYFYEATYFFSAIVFSAIFSARRNANG